MLSLDTFLSPSPALSVVEVWDLHHDVRLDMGIIFMYNLSIVYMGWFLGLRMLPTGTFLSLTSASSAIEVRDHHHEVRLGMLVNLV